MIKASLPPARQPSLVSKNKKSFSHRLFNRSLVLFLGVLLFVLVLVINDLSIKGIIVQDLLKEQEEINKENNALQLKIMDLTSYKTIEERAITMNLVKVDSIDYINFDQTVAKK